MPTSAKRRGSALSSGLSGWALRVAAKRGASQWRLIAVVLLIAIISCTLVTALSVVATATEARAVSGALASTSVADRQMRVSITAPTVTFASAREKTSAALKPLFHDTATTTQSAMAYSTMQRIPRANQLFALGYFGEMDGIENEVSLITGQWPSVIGTSTAIDVALPEKALPALKVTLGDTFLMQVSAQQTITLHLVGVYSNPDSDALYWQTDVMGGIGYDPVYPVPGTGGVLSTDAVGPMVVAPGTLDVTALPLNRIVVFETPTFSTLDVETLIPVTDSFATANTTVPVNLGDVGGGVVFVSTLGPVFASVASALTSTRSTVVLISLMLLVLAVVAVAQTARLMTDARATERSLLRARGSSGSQLVRPSLIETVVVVGVTAAISPVLARLIYQLIAAQPALVAADVPADAALQPTTWIVSTAAAIIFGFVLLFPALAREGTFHEGEQGRARQRRASGFQRSGLDIAVLAIAGVAYWQLLSYRTPVSDGSSLSVDPVIVGAPALVLLAGGLLSVRLVPLAALFAERLASRGRGIMSALASWEVSRRAQRATAALLLLTLSLSVGVFSLAYLATWQDSQRDQALMAVGPPIRVSAPLGSALQVRQDLPSGYSDSPAPALRRPATLASLKSRFSGLDSQTGPDLTLLASNAGGRDLLNVGRLAEEGGTGIVASIPAALTNVGAVPLGSGIGGIRATVTVKSIDPVLGIRATLRAVIEDASGVLSTVNLGSIDMNSQRVMQGAVDSTLLGELRLVGFQLVLYGDQSAMPQDGNPQSYASLTWSDVVTLDRSPLDPKAQSTPVAFDRETMWYSSSDEGSEGLRKFAYFPDDAQLGLQFTIPEGLASIPAVFTTYTWDTVFDVPVVFTTELAATMRVHEGSRFVLVIDDAHVPVVVTGIVDHIPGAGPTGLYNALTLSETLSTTTANTIMLDQQTLARAVAQTGYSSTLVSEWWLNVPSADQASYVSALAAAGITGQSGAMLGTLMQQHPVRVATQAAIWLVALGAALIAALGFAIYATGSLRARSTEFAQMRAVGLSSRTVVGIIAVETTLLGALGAIFGLGLGFALSYLVVPVVGVSANGSPPIPPVLMRIPWEQLSVLAIEVGIVLAVVVVVASWMQRDIDPSSVLRRGD